MPGGRLLSFPSGDVVEPDRPRWGGFALACSAYLAASVGESLLSPIFPTTARDLDLDLTLGGVAFGVLTGSIAVANVVGGNLLPRLGAARLIRLSALLAAVGGVLAATAQSFPQLALAQVLLGGGSGLYFPAGIQAIGLLAGSRRKGFAMGMFGVAFSGGLTIAAVLAAVGADHGWRVPFVISAVLSVASALGTFGLRLPPVAPALTKARLADVMGLPTAVGTIGSVCQYGTVSFLTTFAVDEWGLSVASAASLLAVGRVLSIVAKLVSGASADRRGPLASARRTAAVLVVSGIGWSLLPAAPVTYALAAIFAGTVSSLFPIANVLALDRFGQQGGALGLYRSVQIALGALATFLVGVLADQIGLRPVLAATTLAPLTLFWICREPPRPEAMEVARADLRK
jgi:MFS family permease